MASAPGYSVHWQLQDYATRTIEGLHLPGVVEVAHRRFPLLDGLRTPAVLVCPGRLTASATAGTNERDDIEFGVLVVTAKASTREASANSDDWRTIEENHETIRKAFYNVRPSESFDGACWLGTSVIDGATFIPERWRQQWDAAYWLASFRMRCERG